MPYKGLLRLPGRVRRFRPFPKARLAYRDSSPPLRQARQADPRRLLLPERPPRQRLPSHPVVSPSCQLPGRPVRATGTG